MFLMSVALRGGTQAAVAVVTSSATWSATDKNASITISGAGLVATDGGAAADHTGRGTTATTTITAGQKRYWEIGITNNTNNAGVGIGNASMVFTTGVFLGQDANGIGYFPDGNVWRNFSSIATLSTFTTGDKINVAVDGGNKLWLGKNGVFSGSPGVSGGIDISAFGNCFPAYNLQGSGVNTANFGGAFAFTPPSGFTAFP